MMNINQIKIPEQHYVGFSSRSNGLMPIAFMTPYGTDSLAKKRISTVDAWSRNSTKPPLVIDNTPLSGFKLTSSIRTTNYGGLDKWKIEDPRGFILEISSGNLAQLLAYGILDQGEILDKCVWARCDGENILLSVETQEYIQAIKNTEVSKGKASWKDVRPGNKIILQNGTSGTFLGRYAFFIKTKNTITATEKSYYAIKLDSHDRVEVIRTPKLSQIVDTSTSISEQEAEYQMNSVINENKTSISSIDYISQYCGAFWCNKDIVGKGKQPEMHLTFNDVKQEDIIASKNYIIQTADDQTYFIEYRWTDVYLAYDLAKNQSSKTEQLYPLSQSKRINLSQMQLKNIRNICAHFQTTLGNSLEVSI